MFERPLSAQYVSHKNTLYINFSIIYIGIILSWIQSQYGVYFFENTSYNTYQI